ncbi:ABC transporter ATP-binding protein [Salinicoccus sp. HZC-1]|uniref:ABC transporter ATP-binding protein n=1 Tax=Salinicoccus sp. HZC-1 TaxID=3385497 RepID=UPI00398B2055
MIKSNGLTKTFGSKLAVNRLDFTVGKGELFAFLGPNGSGKSTTIRMLMGLLEPTEGSVEILGEEMRLDKTELKRRISFVPDTPDIIGKLSGREYLNFVASVYGMSQDIYEKELAFFLDLFDLEGKLDTLVENYSHGMRQKLVIIGALMHHPDIIFLDEPTVGLDPKSNRNLKNYLREYVADGHTVFLTTHTLSLAEEIADRILIIYNGVAKDTGTLEELRALVGKPDASLEDVFLELTEEG